MKEKTRRPIESTLGVDIRTDSSEKFSLQSLLRQGSCAHRWLVDTSATIFFFTPFSMLQEVGLAGMSVETSLKTRAIAAFSDLFLGRPYGKFRNYLFKKTDTTTASHWARRMAVDASANIAFWLPIYIGMMYIAGANLRSIVISAVATIPASLVGGRLAGIFMDWIRKMSGLKAAPEHANDRQNRQHLRISGTI
jgi:hypothetical protein